MKKLILIAAVGLMLISISSFDSHTKKYWIGVANYRKGSVCDNGLAIIEADTKQIATEIFNKKQYYYKKDGYVLEKIEVFEIKQKDILK